MENALVSVGNAHDLDMGVVESLSKWDNYDEYIMEHEKECPQCQKDEYCEVVEEGEYESLWCYFFDGELNKETMKIEGSTIQIYISWESNTYQVLQSPKIETRGKCSPCYPNQCDMDAEGDLECMILPSEYIF